MLVIIFCKMSQTVQAIVNIVIKKDFLGRKKSWPLSNKLLLKRSNLPERFKFLFKFFFNEKNSRNFKNVVEWSRPCHRCNVQLVWLWKFFAGSQKQAALIEARILELEGRGFKSRYRQKISFSWNFSYSMFVRPICTSKI